jgi:hypothetical protein
MKKYLITAGIALVTMAVANRIQPVKNVVNP